MSTNRASKNPAKREGEAKRVLKRDRSSSSKITVKEYSSKSRPEYNWVVYWPSKADGGRRKSKRFKTKADANDHKSKKEVELLNDGREAAALHDGFIDDAKWAARELVRFDVSLREVVEDFIERREAREKSARVDEAVVDFCDSKKKDGAGVRYLKDLENRLTRFASEFGGRTMSEVETKEIDEWLRGLKVAPVTRNNFRRIVGVFFSWGEGMGYCSVNPVTRAKRVKEPKEEVEVFSAGELRVILDASPPELVPVLAIGAFAGLRSAEIERLDWQKVDFVKGRIDVDAGVSKTAAHRYVPMSATLRAWLKLYAIPRGPVAPGGSRKRLVTFRRELDGTDPEAKKKAKKEGRPLIGWKNNALRHSFASYSLAIEDDAAKVALWLGHTSPRMTFESYVERVEKDAARDYFNVKPRKRGKSPAVRSGLKVVA